MIINSEMDKLNKLMRMILMALIMFVFAREDKFENNKTLTRLKSNLKFSFVIGRDETKN